MSSERLKSSDMVIPLHVPHMGGREWDYVRECLDTNWVSSVGAFVDKFESVVGEKTGRAHSVATMNGTAALHTALMVAGIGENDEVLMPALTFVASANAVRYTGAWPVFLDVDPETWQLDPKKVQQFIETECQVRSGKITNRQSGRQIRAIMPVHILGHPADMDPLMELADSFNLIVIEDAAEALGALYKGRPAGSHGQMACLSFNGNKIVTSGGGGALVTDNPEWAARARHLTTQAKSHPVEYEHDEVGYNYRLTNIQAALGCAQLEILEEFVEKKRAIAEAYRAALENIPGITPMHEAPWARSTYWMYTIVVDEMQYGMNSRVLLQHLADHRIMSRPLWQPMNLNVAHQKAHSAPCPVSEMLHRKCLSIPCSVGLTDDQQARVIDALRVGRSSS